MKRKLSPYWGNLPRHISGPNKDRMDRVVVAAKYGITISALFKAYWNWQDIFRFEGSDLTFEQYLDKLVETGITPYDVSNRDGQFNLSRFNDEGVYTKENCRFITRRENLLEQFASVV